MSLKQVIEQTSSRAGRRFDLVIQALIVVSLVSFSVETLPDLQPWVSRTLRWTEVVTVAIFSAEYVVRVLVADRKLRFVFSFFGMVDLLAVLPFYLSSGVDLRSLRILRLLRLFRAFKLLRYSQATRRLHRAFLIAKEEIILFFCAALMLLYLSAVGIYYFESEAQPERFRSIFDGLWWAVATLTTVGFGDVYPVTAGGKVFTFAVLMIGLGVVAVPSGMLASALSKARLDLEASDQATGRGSS